MSYLGKTPSQAVRQRYYYTASGAETSLSGADDNGNTLTFTDGAYVDVYLNGVLLVAGTDYNTTTANTIGGLTALSASDVVEIVVYDTFAVFGGEVQGDMTVTNGGFTATQDSTNPVTINRTTSDGDIAVFQKDGSAVGKIGNRSTFFYMRTEGGTNGSGIRLSDGYIMPCASDGSNSDANIDLGLSGSRFKDLYLSGGVYLGGTVAANYLDDYEEGTWTPTISVLGSGSVTISVAYGTYTKVGTLVNIEGYIDLSAISSPNGYFTIDGLPYASRTDVGSRRAGSLFFQNSNSANIADFILYMNTGSTVMIVVLGDGVSQQLDSANQLKANTDLRFGMTYSVNS
jgi:hypothetical protein